MIRRIRRDPAQLKASMRWVPGERLARYPASDPRAFAEVLTLGEWTGWSSRWAPPGRRAAQRGPITDTTAACVNHRAGRAGRPAQPAARGLEVATQAAGSTVSAHIRCGTPRRRSLRRAGTSRPLPTCSGIRRAITGDGYTRRMTRPAPRSTAGRTAGAVRATGPFG
jgi:hypothetical protein